MAFRDAVSSLEAKDGEARARDGIRLAYSLVAGEGPGRLALAHSLAMDRSFWDGVVPLLSRHADILVLDCRGHGASGKPAGPYTVELFADDLADLMDAVGWPSAAIAGASMGGCVALAFAGRYRERTEALGLIDTTAWYGPTAAEDWEGRAQKALQAGMEALVDFQKIRWFGDRFRAENPKRVQRALDVFLANDLAAYAEACRMLGHCDLRAVLGGLPMPVRILVGEEDYATPVAMAEAMHAAIPQSELTVIPAARHFTPIEVPEPVAAELAALLAGAAPPPDLSSPAR